ncbi:hypothetical protein RFI_30936 [Reticulomyxa filosa]|uniref:Uncharacterized protein n=1 Tax=Reticulomyxa filosa TaxID=46433 RepID=X6LZ91_RETFI|nr:hypothetical protein RFI_30936 [Reticulomyxa filosa]|eukprot:ETO06457.1 hypothetical protein RFI_30936 [Reticulomyxa filosa]
MDIIKYHFQGLKQTNSDCSHDTAVSKKSKAKSRVDVFFCRLVVENENNSDSSEGLVFYLFQGRQNARKMWSVGPPQVANAKSNNIDDKSNVVISIGEIAMQKYVHAYTYMLLFHLINQFKFFIFFYFFKKRKAIDNLSCWQLRRIQYIGDKNTNRGAVLSSVRQTIPSGHKESLNSFQHWKMLKNKLDMLMETRVNTRSKVMGTIFLKKSSLISKKILICDKVRLQLVFLQQIYYDNEDLCIMILS